MVRAPLKATVAASVVSVITTLVTVSTVPPKVAPPELVTVKLPMLVPMVRKMLTAPVVLIMMFDGQVESSTKVPLMEPMVTAPEPPPPSVKVMPVAMTMLSNSTGMGPKSKVVLPPTNVVVPSVN